MTSSEHLEIGRSLAREEKHEEAFPHLEIAMQMANPEATYALGNWYFYGIHVQRDMTKAFQFFRRAAILGFPDAMSDLAICYEKGDGTEPNLRHALRWYRLLFAKQGNASTAVEIAGFYFHGVGTRRRPRQAARYYRMAARLGSGEGAYSYAYCLEFGNGVPKNLRRALKWYRESLKRGFWVKSSRKAIRCIQRELAGSQSGDPSD